MDNREMIIEGLLRRLNEKLEQQNELLHEALKEKETIQTVVSPDAVSDYLSAGWSFVASYSNGRETFVVVEIDETKRR